MEKVKLIDIIDIIKLLPTNEAIAEIKARLTGLPETIEIDGELVVYLEKGSD